MPLLLKSALSDLVNVPSLLRSNMNLGTSSTSYLEMRMSLTNFILSVNSTKSFIQEAGHINFLIIKIRDLDL